MTLTVYNTCECLWFSYSMCISALQNSYSVIRVFFFRKNVLLLFSSLASFGAGWVDHNGIVGFSIIGMWEGTSYDKKGAGKKYNF